MVYRQVDFSASVRWDNPLKHVQHKPFLEDIVFPVHGAADETDPGAPYAQLHRYYTDRRADGEIDTSALRDFLEARRSGIFVIKGDVGVGKTWFLRYFLEYAFAGQASGKPDLGIIDMWHKPYPSALENAHYQLDTFLNAIVDSREGGLRAALAPEAHHYARTTSGANQDSRRYSRSFDRYFENLLGPDRRIERNLERLSYLERNQRPIVLGIDNLDRYSETEQGDLFGLMIKLLRYPNIRLVVAVRPSTHFTTKRSFDAGEFYYNEMEMQKLDYAAMLRSRFSTAHDGTDLSTFGFELSRSDYDPRQEEEVRPTDSESSKPENRLQVTWPQVLDIFIGGLGFQLLTQLGDSDIRQTLKLMRRVLYSDNLIAVSNLKIGYHFISAAMLRRSQDFRPDESYILNLFDDDHPDRAGNSLIRYRVLEYFVNGHRRIGEDYFYETYFRRLGYDQKWVASVLELFVDSGLLRSSDGREGTLEKVDELVPTTQGRLYFGQLVRNKWYIYSIKRGMAIDEVFIKKRSLGNYQWREWIEDDQLVDYFIQEEELEADRVKRWIDATGLDPKKYGQLSRVSDIVRQTLGL
jgi:hypothetical protein